MKQSKIKFNNADFKFLNNKQKEKLTIRVLRRIQILAMAAKGVSDTHIAKTLSVGRTTVWRTLKRFEDQGVKKALEEQHRPGQPTTHTDKQDASLIAMACTDAPTGHKHWTVRLLAETAANNPALPKLSREAVRLLLKQQDCKPWLKKNVVHSQDYA